jgi:hypothetical protein
MNELEREGQRLKEYLIQAMELADFVVKSSSGTFIKQNCWELRRTIEKSGVELKPCDIIKAV